MKPNGALSKTELKFWIPIISIIVGGVIAFVGLEGKVGAANERAARLRQEHEVLVIEYKSLQLVLYDMGVDMGRLQKDVEYLSSAMEKMANGK